MFDTNCITLSVSWLDAAPSGRKNSCRMKRRSLRARMPLRIAKLNTISGTSDSSVV